MPYAPSVDLGYQQNTNVTLISVTASTTTQVSPDQSFPGAKGISVCLNTTNIGTGSLTVLLQGKDPLSGAYYTMVTGTPVTTNTTVVYTLYPGAFAIANLLAGNILPNTWRVQVTANNANAADYTVGATILYG